MNKKKNNKGFSLVELIVVVAIMAVLVVVLAPAYLRYVEKSRLQKDVSAVGEVVQSIKIAAASQEVSDQINDGTVVIKVVSGQAPATAGGKTALDTELAASIGTITFSSDTLEKATNITIEVSKATDNSLQIDVKGAAELDILDEGTGATKEDTKKE